jgi:hypothetical protein
VQYFLPVPFSINQGILFYDDILAMVGFLLAPILSFFSARLYRKVLQSGFGAGFSYLLYLTILFSILCVFLCQFLLLPFVGNFMDWLVMVTPEITITQTGLTTEAAQPYLVKHPSFGPLYLIDTTKDASELIKDKDKAAILIGREDIIIRDADGARTRSFSLRQAMLAAHEAHQAIRITKNMMRDFGKRFQSWVIPVVLIVLAPLFFTWKLLAALFYSFLAWLLNFFKKEKFHYRNLFALSCYAISPVTMLQAVHFSIPDARLDLNLLYAFGLTFLYLAFGMFVASRYGLYDRSKVGT